jgi:hypothetical protein
MVALMKSETTTSNYLAHSPSSVDTDYLVVAPYR